MTTNTDTTAASGAASLGPLNDRAVLDAIRSAYDLGYNDARNARTVPGDSAPGYKGRDVERDHGGALIHALSRALAAPAAQEAEPVVTVQSYTNGSYSRNYKLQWHRDVPEGTKLYAHPPRPQAGAVAVPEGWRLVPVEPTPGMLSVGAYNVQCDYDSTIETIARHAYRVMVEAAPQAPAAPMSTQPVHHDSTPGLRVGDSSFDHWFQQQPFATQTGVKQIARDAYAAGMGDPLVVPAVAPAAGAAPTQHITEPYTVAEIRERVASGDYSAELMLQHALLHLGAGAAPTDAAYKAAVDHAHEILGRLLYHRDGDYFVNVNRAGAEAMHVSTVAIISHAALIGAAAPAQEAEDAYSHADVSQAHAEGYKLGLAQAAPLTQAARDVLAERRRQVEAEGWTPEHDDQYPPGTMARAAGCYATINTYPTPTMWPWAPEWWKPRDDRSNYVRASALLLAELERHDRAAARARQEG